VRSSKRIELEYGCQEIVFLQSEYPYNSARRFLQHRMSAKQRVASNSLAIKKYDCGISGPMILDRGQSEGKHLTVSSSVFLRNGSIICRRSRSRTRTLSSTPRMMVGDSVLLRDSLDTCLSCRLGTASAHLSERGEGEWSGRLSTNYHLISVSAAEATTVF
jgi:hypothetical protein